MTILETHRRKRGLTGQALAQLAGLHPAELSNVERLRLLPRPGFRKAIAEVLGIPEDELFADFPDRIPLKEIEQ